MKGKSFDIKVRRRRVVPSYLRGFIVISILFHLFIITAMPKPGKLSFLLRETPKYRTIKTRIIKEKEIEKKKPEPEKEKKPSPAVKKEVKKPVPQKTAKPEPVKKQMVKPAVKVKPIPVTKLKKTAKPKLPVLVKDSYPKAENSPVIRHTPKRRQAVKILKKKTPSKISIPSLPKREPAVPSQASVKKDSFKSVSLQVPENPAPSPSIIEEKRSLTGEEVTETPNVIHTPEKKAENTEESETEIKTSEPEKKERGRLEKPGNTDSSGTGKVDMNEVRAFQGMISSRIDQVKIYPGEARRSRIEGTTLISFMISPDGRVSMARILESSGYNLLDEAALKAAKSGGPYLPYPRNLNRSIRIKLKIVFELEGA